MSFFNLGWAAPDCSLAFEGTLGWYEGAGAAGGGGLDEGCGRLGLNSRTLGELSAACARD